MSRRRTTLKVLATRWPLLVAATVTLAWTPAAGAATYTVSSTADSGPGSIRSAAILTNAGTGGDTIMVPASATPYILTSGELAFSKPVTIAGGGAGATTISGNSSSRILNFLAGAATGPDAVTGVTLTAGRSATGGGAIAATGGTLTLTGVVLDGNTATAGGGGGLRFGGNGSSSDVLTISASTFSGNTSSSYGGAIYQGGGGLSHDTMMITTSVFSGNTAGTDRDGGAIAAGGGGGATDVTTIANVTIVGNKAPGTASTGGGLRLYAPTIHLTDATIDDNTAASGGGVNVPASAVLVNTILAGNHGGTAAAANCANAVTSGGHNLESGTACGFTGAGDRVSTDPLLGILRDNGGPTLTQMLQPGSPAIDGANSSVGPLDDQRGVARPQGTANDIGALEVAPPSVSTSPATAAAARSATFNGSAQNPSVAAGTTSFEYGSTLSYGAQTPGQTLAAGAGPTAFSAPVTGLDPGTLVHFRAVVSNPDRTAYGADQTFVTTTAPPGTTPPTPTTPLLPGSAPRLRGLKLLRSSFPAAAGRGGSLGVAATRASGTTISYTDSQQATATLTVQRVRRGYRVGLACVAERPRHRKGTVRRCARYGLSGSFTHADVAGANRLFFTGRVKGRRLAPGGYRLSVVARDRAGRSSPVVRVSFRVQRPR